MYVPFLNYAPVVHSLCTKHFRFPKKVFCNATYKCVSEYVHSTLQFFSNLQLQYLQGFSINVLSNRRPITIFLGYLLQFTTCSFVRASITPKEGWNWCHPCSDITVLPSITGEARVHVKIQHYTLDEFQQLRFFSLNFWVRILSWILHFFNFLGRGTIDSGLSSDRLLFSKVFSRERSIFAFIFDSADWILPAEEVYYGFSWIYVDIHLLFRFR